MNFVDFLFAIFFITFQIIYWIVLEFIFKVNVLQKDLSASLMVSRDLALLRLYLFRFSDEFVLNFLSVA